MTMAKRWITGLLALTIAAGACVAEEPAEPPKFYKMDFVVKEVDGAKVLNSRTYSTMVSTGQSTEIRAGSKITFTTQPGSYQQIDLGVNIDVRGIKEMQDRLAFYVMAEVSSVPGGLPELGRPTIRQNRWASSMLVALKKPTLLFSSENVDTKSQMQVEVTATPVP
jgi:hypothetical protein